MMWPSQMTQVQGHIILRFGAQHRKSSNFDLIATTGYVKNIESGPARHGNQMRFSLLFTIRMVAEQKFIVQITKPLIQISCQTNGIS